MAVRGVLPLEVVVVEVGVADVLDPALEAAGYQDVIQGLEAALEREAVALLLGRLVPEVVQGRCVDSVGTATPALPGNPSFFGSCSVVPIDVGIGGPGVVSLQKRLQRGQVVGVYVVHFGGQQLLPHGLAGLG